MVKPGNSSYDGAGHPYELLVRSPWMVSDRGSGAHGDSGGVRREHTPEIALPGPETPAGIQQERLALSGGSRLLGRVILSGAPAQARWK